MSDPVPDPSESPSLGIEGLPAAVEEAFYDALIDVSPEEAAGRLAALQEEFPDYRQQLAAAAERLQVGGAVLSNLDSAETTPEWIGPYRVLRKLGEGGFGIVYLAEQQGELRREVAVKCLLPGMDSRRILARFEAERQALAKMSHPCIAQVFDVGMSEAGRPYFVMEHVPGRPVTEYCEAQGLGMVARIALFGSICDGVHHAHQKGVIHRDLKPSNILVATESGRALPKVIDFGVAKSLHRTEAESPRTEAGRLLGTLEYMSPEQAAGRASEVDTRSDVYSLGVVLYELLTGCLPFDSDQVRRRNPTELQHLMQHQDPERPSQRLSRSRRKGTTHSAAARAAAGASVAPVSVEELRGDLDWIVMRALEKDPARRYESAVELRMDLERFLGNEPVRAHPPSRTYLLRKFVRRHRASVLAAALVAAALIIGLLLTGVYYLDAKRNLQRFEQLADLVLIGDLIRQEPTLWPEHPDKVPAMESWMQRAVRISARLPEHRRALAEVARRGRPRAVSERAASAIAPAAAVASPAESAPASPAASPAEAPTAAASAGDGSGGLEFADSRDRFLHGSLRRLVSRLEALTDADDGLVRRVQERLRVARTIEQRTVGDHAAAWQKARTELRGDPRFAGVDLKPQIGLVPLGADPTSGLQEFAHLRSGAPATRGPDGKLAFGAKTGLVFVLIPGGSCAVGSQPDSAEEPNFDLDSGVNERPVDRVTLGPFFLSKFEMTQGQWKFATGGTPARINPSGRQPYLGQHIGWDHPVEHVAWDDVDVVCRQLDLVLPTEAQWEYACRAGTGSRYYTGEDLASLAGHANLMDRSAAPHFGKERRGSAYHRDFEDGFAGHAPVQTFAANPFGLVAMHGNVGEMTADWATRYGETPARPGDGLRGDQVRTQKLKVTRGGSYFELARAARCSNRSGLDPTSRDFVTGVRPARVLE